MSILLEQITLNPEKEKNLTSEAVRKYIKMTILEQELQKQQKEISNNLSPEEMRSIAEYFNIPKYLSVREVSQLTGLSQQIVRRHCANNKFTGYQTSGVNGIWNIESEQFTSHPNWSEFITKRNENFKRSQLTSNLAINLLNLEIDSED